jgi:hypothetical protein
VKVATCPARLTVPRTGTTPAARVNVVAETLAGASASEKVAETAVPMGTPVAPASGLTAVTVGGVRSGAAPVVNVQTKSAARLFPATSSTPVVIRAV